MIYGIIAAILFLLEGVIVFAFKVKKHNKPRSLIRILSIISFLLVIVTGIHLITVLDLWRQRPLLMNLTGLIMAAIIVIHFILYIISSSRNNELKLSSLKYTVIIIFILLAIHVYSGFRSMSLYKESVNKIDVKNLDISKIADGIYEGEHDVGYICARVKVAIKSGEIVDIVLLEHRHEKGEAAEIIIEKIIKEQKIDVDAIASATNSSNVIKKAVENALKGVAD